MILGIRAHDIECTLPQKQEDHGIDVRINHIETLGDCVLTHVTTEGGIRPAVSLGTRTPFKVGDHVMIRLNVHHAHLFQKGALGRSVISRF